MNDKERHACVDIWLRELITILSHRRWSMVQFRFQFHNNPKGAIVNHEIWFFEIAFNNDNLNSSEALVVYKTHIISKRNTNMVPMFPLLWTNGSWTVLQIWVNIKTMIIKWIWSPWARTNFSGAFESILVSILHRSDIRFHFGKHSDTFRYYWETELKRDLVRFNQKLRSSSLAQTIARIAIRNSKYSWSNYL